MSAVSIYDIMGRLVTERHSINATQTIFDALTASKQVLIVKITSVDGVVVTKKIVY
jgi:hypothetical protein